jgi:hypothetical protein
MDELFACRKNYSKLFPNLSQLSFAGRTFTVLNPELDLLYLVIHGGLHGFFRLKWLVDIKIFWRKLLLTKKI